MRQIKTWAQYYVNWLTRLGIIRFSLLLALFIGLPLIWTAMMGWVGVQVGGELGKMLSSTERGANQSASASSSAVTKGRVR